MNLSKNFTLAEATFSSTAIRCGISNTPNDAQLANMRLAADGMEQIRAILGHPIHIDSWLRTAALNAAVGGVGHSAHMDGYAVDFICPGFGTPQEIVKAISEHIIPYDQMIQEGAWVHISFAPARRQQILLAHFTPGQKTTYTEWIA